jgi:NhaA family Na+:H+ antiporter
MVIKNISSINDFFKLESAGGILLIISAVLAIIFANSPFSGYYDLLLDTPVEIRIGALEIAKPLLLWVNDGLMAVFFLLVGLELKRELVEGELSDKSQIVLPAIGALGGMLVPALIYTYFNYEDPIAMQG